MSKTSWIAGPLAITVLLGLTVTLTAQAPAVRSGGPARVVGWPPEVAGTTELGRAHRLVYVNNTHVNVPFVELAAPANLDPVTSQNAGNYLVTSPAPLVILAANLLAPNIIQLTTTAMQAGTYYSIRVTNVADADNEVIVDNGVTNVGWWTSPPFFVLDGVAVGPNTVDIHFTELLDPVSSQNIVNYVFAPGLPLAGAVLQPDGKTVRITTVVPLASGTNYKLTVSNVLDAGMVPIVIDGIHNVTWILVPMLFRDWTVMIYMDGDNDLEPWAIADFNELELVGSTPNVNIVVQFDRSPSYDTSNGNWITTRRYFVLHDLVPNNINSFLISDQGELDMGAPNTLSDFVQWGVSSYPADHYALVLWNHGGGWRDRSEVRSKKTPPGLGGWKECCWDETNGNDVLYNWEIRYALETAGTPMDLLGFDVCLAGMMEVAYEMRNVASAMVASAALEPAQGWPYDTIMAQLNVNPAGTTGLGLANIVVSKYAASLPLETMTALDLTRMPLVGAALTSFCNTVTSRNDEWPAIDKSWNETCAPLNNALYYSVEPYLGFAYFLQRVTVNAADPAVIAAANNLLGALSAAISSTYNGNGYSNGGGLGIYFPPPGMTIDPDYRYVNLQMLADTTWDEFLAFYQTADRFPPPSPTTLAIDNPELDGIYTVKWTETTDVSGIRTYELGEMPPHSSLFSDKAESGPGNWTMAHTGTNAVDWTISGSGYHSPVHAFWSGRGDFIDNTMTLNAGVGIPFAGVTELVIWRWYELESFFDYASLEMELGSNPGSWIVLRSYTGYDTNWRADSFDLTPYAGDTVRLRLACHTDYLNNYRGFYADDILIRNRANPSSSWQLVELHRDFVGQLAGTWDYFVRAQDAANNWSPWSNIESTVVLGGPPTIASLTVQGATSPPSSPPGGRHQDPVALSAAAFDPDGDPIERIQWSYSRDDPAVTPTWVDLGTDMTPADPWSVSFGFDDETVWLRARAYANAQWGAWYIANTTFAANNSAPARIVTLTAADHPNDNGGAIDLNWTGYVPPPDVDHYKVYRALAHITDVSLVGVTLIATIVNPAAISYTDNTTVDGTNYWYAVTPLDSLNHEQVLVTDAGPVTSVNDQAPPPVQNLTATDKPADLGGAINLDWVGYIAPPDFLRYNIYRSTSNFTDVSSMAPIHQINVAGTQQYTDNTTTDGVNYWYAVTCEDVVNNENHTVVATGPVQSVNNLAPPAKITTLTVADHPGDDGGKIDLDWTGYTPPPDFDHYNIYRALAAFANVGGMVPIDTVSVAGQMTFTDPTTTDGTNYWYAVTCVNGLALEDPVVNAAGPVTSVNDKAPDLVVALASDTPADQGGSIDITWTTYAAPADFAFYRLYRDTAAFTSIVGKVPLISLNNPATKQYADTTTTNGTNYWYAVACEDTVGNKLTTVAAAGPVTSVDNMAPGPPTNLALAPVGRAALIVALQWDRSPDDGIGANDVTKYVVYRDLVEIIRVDATDALQYVYRDTSVSLEGGHSYSYTVRAFDGTNLSTPAGPLVTQPVSAPTISRTFLTGMTMWTFPGTPVDPALDPHVIIGTRAIWRFDVGVQNYVQYPQAPNPPPVPPSPFDLHPGRGFFVNFPADTPVMCQAVVPRSTDPFDLPIALGWNLLGNPRTYTMSWATLSGIPAGCADAFGWILPQGSSGYMLVASVGGLNAVSEVPPYAAFWVYGNAAGTLRVPGAGAAAAEVAAAEAPALRVHWKVPVTVCAQGARDSCNYLGEADQALGIPNPPPTQNYVDAFFTPQGDQSPRLAYDLRAPAAGVRSWDFTVVTDMPNTDVTVALADLSELPRGTGVVLTDLDAGRSVYARTQRNYVFNSGPEAAARHFRVEVGEAKAGTLAVTGVTAQANRGAAGGTITYSLSTAASVDVAIYNIAGRLIRQVQRGLAGKAGLNSVLWDGRSSTGSLAPGGIYLLEVHASSEDGQRAKGLGRLVTGR